MLQLPGVFLPDAATFIPSALAAGVEPPGRARARLLSERGVDTDSGVEGDENEKDFGFVSPERADKGAGDANEKALGLGAEEGPDGAAGDVKEKDFGFGAVAGAVGACLARAESKLRGVLALRLSLVSSHWN